MYSEDRIKGKVGKVRVPFSGAQRSSRRAAAKILWHSAKVGKVLTLWYLARLGNYPSSH